MVSGEAAAAVEPAAKASWAAFRMAEPWPWPAVKAMGKMSGTPAIAIIAAIISDKHAAGIPAVIRIPPGIAIRWISTIGLIPRRVGIAPGQRRHGT